MCCHCSVHARMWRGRGRCVGALPCVALRGQVGICAQPESLAPARLVVLRSLAAAGDEAGMRMAIRVDVILHGVDWRRHGSTHEPWPLVSSRFTDIVRRHGARRRACRS